MEFSYNYLFSSKNEFFNSRSFDISKFESHIMLTDLQKMPKQKQKQIITKQRTKKL